MDLSAEIDQFLSFLESEMKASHFTIKDYRHYLQELLDFVKKDRKVVKVSSFDLNQELIHRYQLHLSRRGLKNSTKNYFLISLRSFLRYVKSQGRSLSIEPDQVKLHAHSKVSAQVVENEGLEQLVNSPDNSKEGLRDKALLSLLSEGGLKVSEICLLNRGDINFIIGQVSVLGNKKRVIDLPFDTVNALERYLGSRDDQYRPLFIRFKGAASLEEDGEKMRLSARSIERVVRKYARRLNLKATPQALRHSLTQKLFSQGERASYIQETLGHTNPSTTKLYITTLRSKTS